MLKWKNNLENFPPIGKPRLSGTGSTIFIEFNEENSAKEVLEKFPHLVFTKSLERSPLMQIIE